MNKWQTIKLKEVVKIISGYAFKSKDFKENNGVPVIKIGNINYYDVDICKNISYVDKSFLSKIDEKFIIRRDDILISLTGSHINQPNSMVGRVGKYREDKLSLLNQRAGKIMPEKNVCREFIYHLFSLKSMTYLIATIAYGGANQVNISPKTIENLKIQIPDLETQEKIADILSTYDRLIENNNRRIEILEKSAEEIYKEWFVRMRFPGHENTKFIKGIPEGWEVKRVGDLGRVETGKTPSTKKEEYYDGNIMFVKTPDMHNNMFTLNTEIYLSKEGSDSQPKKLLPKNSIMVSCIGTGGVVSINGELAHTNQQINSIILKDLKLREWTYFTLKSMKKTIELFGATGATMTNLSKGKFQNLKVLYPTDELIIKFNNINKDIFEEIKNLIFQNQNLIKQRDLLLPRLMNGTIEVK